MKRMVIAVVILIFTVGLNIYGKINVEKLCEKTTAVLYKVEESIKNDETENAKKLYGKIPEIEKITPFIYSEEVKSVETELVDLKSYLEENDKINASVSAKKCIFLLKKIKEKEKLSLSSFF